MKYITSLPFVLLLVIVSVVRGRVLELDERFREAKNSGKWLVMFYAPWCGHCKQLEPTWMEVGQHMFESKSDVQVARVDCTKFSSLASDFQVRGFPTIKFITGGISYEYRGSRSKNDIIGFANKAQGSPVTDLGRALDIETAESKHEVLFLYVGEGQSKLKGLYSQLAKQLFLQINFYSTKPEFLPDGMQVSSSPMILVLKDGSHFEMPYSADDADLDKLVKWVVSEQHPAFSELAGGSYGKLKSTGKSLVVMVLPDADSEDLFDIGEEIGMARHKILHSKYVFCWVTGNKIVNSITYGTISVPNVLVYDHVSMEYYVMSEWNKDDSEITYHKSEVLSFLRDVSEGKVPAQGGSGFLQKIKMLLLDLINTVTTLFSESPILGSIVIVVPTLIITCLCYCLCTLDDSGPSEYPTDSEEEGEEDAEELPPYEEDAGSNTELRQRISPGESKDNDDTEISNEELPEEDKNK